MTCIIKIKEYWNDKEKKKLRTEQEDLSFVPRYSRKGHTPSGKKSAGGKRLYNSNLTIGFGDDCVLMPFGEAFDTGADVG